MLSPMTLANSLNRRGFFAALLGLLIARFRPKKLPPVEIEPWGGVDFEYTTTLDFAVDQWLSEDAFAGYVKLRPSERRFDPARLPA